jgi:hypothetical protein
VKTKLYLLSVVLLYAYLAVTGAEPFFDSERGAVPPGARRGPGGLHGWTTGFMGGK